MNLFLELILRIADIYSPLSCLSALSLVLEPPRLYIVALISVNRLHLIRLSLIGRINTYRVEPRSRTDIVNGYLIRGRLPLIQLESAVPLGALR